MKNCNRTPDLFSANLHEQVEASIFILLWNLIDVAWFSISSTILYSLERGSEGIQVSIDEATLARKLAQ